MNFPHFLARRIAFSSSKSFTKVIIRIAIAAVALSVATMIITSATIEGFKSEISTKVFGFWGHIHITDTNINRTFEQVPIEKNPAYLEEIKTVGSLEYQAPVTFFGRTIKDRYKTKSTKGGVSHVQPFALAPGILTTKEEFGAIVLKGVDESYQWDYLPDFILEGDSLDIRGDISDGIIISAVTSRQYGLTVGDRFIVSFIRDMNESRKRFTVKGIYNTGLEEYDKTFALVDLRKVQEVLQWNENQVSGFEVFLDDPADLDIVSEYLYSGVLPPRLYTETIRAKYPNIFDWLELQDINEVIIMVLMVIVAVINMITILLVFILERTRMIGLLKALGGDNWTVRKVFLYNAGYIIFFGLLIGNVVGISLCLLQEHFRFIKLDEASYYLSYAPVLLIWWNIVLINIATFGVTLLFLILPTHLISKITPVKSLRFD